MASTQLKVSLKSADVVVTTNKILNYTMSLLGNIITMLFYIVFSPFICLLMLVYPTKEGEQGEPEELKRLSIVEEEDDENPFQQSEESKELQKKIKNIRF